MNQQPDLSAQEWNIIVELLVRERGDLPSEVRRTMTSSVKDDLKHRLQLVESALEKLSQERGA